MEPPDNTAPDVKFRKPPTTRSPREPVSSYGAKCPTEYADSVASPPTASKPSTSPCVDTHDSMTKPEYCAMMGSMSNTHFSAVQQSKRDHPTSQTHNPCASRLPWPEHVISGLQALPAGISVQTSARNAMLRRNRRDIRTQRRQRSQTRKPVVRRFQGTEQLAAGHPSTPQATCRAKVLDEKRRIRQCRSAL